jgi:hypothetical protein
MEFTLVIKIVEKHQDGPLRRVGKISRSLQMNYIFNHSNGGAQYQIYKMLDT